MTDTKKEGATVMDMDPKIQEVVNHYLQAMIYGILKKGLPYNAEGLTFFNNTITTPEGGVYHLVFSHVEGPKMALTPEVDLTEGKEGS